MLTSSQDGIARLDIYTEPSVQDSWLQFTWYNGVTSPQSQEPWIEVVKRVDDLIMSVETVPGTGRYSGEPLICDYYRLRDRSFCLRCKTPAALLVDQLYCPECEAGVKDYVI